MSMSVSKRVAKRVAERNQWNTFSEPSLSRVFQVVRTGGFKPKVIPSSEEMDQLFPIAQIDWELVRKPPPHRVQSTWIGHASLLVQMAGKTILTDPVFSRCCSPVPFLGPARYRDPACTIDELKRNHIHVDVVLVSHNHYDHLDYRSVKQLASIHRPVRFVVALGLKRWFERYVPESLQEGNVVDELDWHETVAIVSSGDDNDNDNDDHNEKHASLEITAVPMQHWSNRTGFDRDQTLWCGFVVKTTARNLDDKGKGRGKTLNFLFPGDTGFFEGLYDIGRTHGPFDLAALPIGAYSPQWFMEPMHTSPEDAVKMMDAVRAQKAVAIHWGTFPLTSEPVMEPKERLQKELERVGKDPSSFVATRIGETISS